MTEDLRAFTLAFSAAWGILAAYLVYLHVLEVRLARAVRDAASRLDDAEGKLK